MTHKLSNSREIEKQRITDLNDLKKGEDYDPARYAPGTHGCHEALHVTALVSNLVAEDIMGHQAIIANPDWYRRATLAFEHLQALYQSIGAVHLDTPDN